MIETLQSQCAAALGRYFASFSSSCSAPSTSATLQGGDAAAETAGGTVVANNNNNNTSADSSYPSSLLCSSSSSVDPKRAVDELLGLLGRANDNPFEACEAATSLRVVAVGVAVGANDVFLTHSQRLHLQDAMGRHVLPILASPDHDAAIRAAQVINGYANSEHRSVRDMLWEPMVWGVMNERTSLVEWTTHLRRVLSLDEVNELPREVAHSGVVDRLVELVLSDDDRRRNENDGNKNDDDRRADRLRAEAGWALTNIAGGPHSHTCAVVASGGIHAFLSLLGPSNNDDLKRHGAWGLGNVAGDSSLHRDMVLDSGAVEALVAALHDDDDDDSRRPPPGPELLRTAAWSFSNFFRPEPHVRFASFVRPALPTLARLLRNNDDEDVLRYACWALADSVSHDDAATNADGSIDAVVDAGVCPQVAALLRHSSAKVQAPALRVVAAISSSGGRRMHMILDHDPIPHVVSLLSSSDKVVRNGACVALAHLVRGSHERVQAALDHGVAPPLYQLLASPALSTRKEAAQLVRILAESGTPDQNAVLLEAGFVPQLCDLLTLEDRAREGVLPALSSLMILLTEGVAKERRDSGIRDDGTDTDGNRTDPANTRTVRTFVEAGGLKSVRDLERIHPDVAIHKKGFELLENFFGGDDDDDEVVAAIAGPEGDGEEVVYVVRARPRNRHS